MSDANAKTKEALKTEGTDVFQFSIATTIFTKYMNLI